MALGNLTIQKSIQIFLVTAFAYFAWLMIKLTFEYIPVQSDVSFLLIKQTEVRSRPEYLPIFYVHVYSSIFVLLAGFFAIIRKQFGTRNFHKIMGRVYIISLLLFSAPSGIYMGYYANGGWTSKLSFVILGILWWYVTYKAYRLARQKKFKIHKKWMWRSFALTLSAVTLRFWKMLIVFFFQPAPMDVYQIVAWAGWVPNILFVEYLIYKKKI